MDGEVMEEKRMRLRYDGTCRLCRAELPATAEAIYERSAKTVRCLTHEADPTDEVPPDSTATTGAAALEALITAGAPAVATPSAAPVDPGTPGASARREYERRKAKREERIRNKHPRMGGLILALSDDPQTTNAWDTGALGEERLGRRLNELASEELRVLHDRRIPGTKANIDHLAVTLNGVFVIDAKKYKGRPTLKIEGGLFRPRSERLLVGSRDCTKVVDGVIKQVGLVRSVLGQDVLIQGFLCFVGADWPLIGGSFSTRDVEVLWPKRLYPKLQAPGGLGVDEVAQLHERLAAAFPPA